MSLVMRLGWPGFRPSLLPFWNLFWGLGFAIILSVLSVLYGNKAQPMRVAISPFLAFGYHKIKPSFHPPAEAGVLAGAIRLHRLSHG